MSPPGVIGLLKVAQRFNPTVPTVTFDKKITILGMLLISFRIEEIFEISVLKTFIHKTKEDIRWTFDEKLPVYR